MSAKLPSISIITPSYNQDKFIEDTIKSVLNQDYPEFEYIVMDGGSTDQTLDVLRGYENSLVWVSESDRGQSHAINKGLQMSTGQVLCFLNSDDLLEPEALMKVGNFYANHPEAEWLTGKCRIIDNHGKEIRKSISLRKRMWLQLRSYTVLLVLNYIDQPATFWRRRVQEKIGYFDETLVYAMDYDFWLRTASEFKLWFIDSYLACFRLHQSSKTSSNTIEQLEEQITVAKRYTSAPILLGLHSLHNAMTMAIYTKLLRRMLTRGETQWR